MILSTRSDEPIVSIWRETLYEIIFRADTPDGKYFDIGLILLIFSSVIVV